MPKLNPYLIKENYKKVEEVREIKNEIPSYEEFMENYNENKEVVDSYENEFDSYDDIRVNRSYGPGNNASSEKKQQAAASVAIGTGLVVTTAICPPLVGAMSAVYSGGGFIMKVAGEASGNEDLAKAGEVIGTGGGIGSLGGGFVGSSSHACSGCRTLNGKEIWKIRN